MPETYRVLVTGSRTWKDWRAVHDALTAAADEARAAGCATLTVVAGAAHAGGDHDAMQWAAIHGDGYGDLSITYEPHPADWFAPGWLDKAAGFRRNAEMVALGADLCLAFVMPCAKSGCRQSRPHGSHGTTHCADLAEKAGIEVRRFTDQGGESQP